MKMIKSRLTLIFITFLMVGISGCGSHSLDPFDIADDVYDEDYFLSLYSLRLPDLSGTWKVESGINQNTGKEEKIDCTFTIPSLVDKEFDVDHIDIDNHFNISFKIDSCSGDFEDAVTYDTSSGIESSDLFVSGYKKLNAPITDMKIKSAITSIDNFDQTISYTIHFIGFDAEGKEFKCSGMKTWEDSDSYSYTYYSSLKLKKIK